MKTTYFPTLLCSCLALLSGCGDGSMEDSDAASGGSEAGGGAMSGGASGGGSESGGASSGGASSGGSAGNPLEGMHCSPGPTYDAIAYASLLTNCGKVGGVGEGQTGTRSINIEEPIGPGDTYAFSVEMASVSSNRMEIWGATEECGDGLELLGTAEMGQGIRCFELAPQEGTYTHLSWVWYGGGSHGDVTFCPGGTCGN